MKRFLVLTAAALIFVGCSDFTEQDALPTTEIDAPETIHASFEEIAEHSRTYLDKERYMRWTENDEISYFPGITYNMQYRFAGSTGERIGSFNKMTFDPVTGADLACNYAVYPYAETTSISTNGVISFNLPATQTYVENSFGLGANTMVAATQNIDDKSLSFKNVCGYLKLQLYGEDTTIKSIEFRGNDNEKIAGAATITASYDSNPTVSMTESATTSITLDCIEGVKLSADSANPTAFWLVIPEQTFENGFTITVTDTNGGKFEKATQNSVAITRNTIQPMKAAKAECKVSVPKPANNEIWYTADEKIELAKYDTIYSSFGAELTSHDFNEITGEGIIVFDRNLTKLGNNAFQYNVGLRSIQLPQSITSIGQYAFYQCRTLNTINIPKRVSYIDKDAFDMCERLNHIYLEDIYAWCGVSMYGKYSSPSYGGAYMYLNGEKISKLVIPCTVKIVKPHTFMGVNLEEIIISEGVETLGLNAFKSCSYPKKVYIPRSVTDLGCNTFEFCYGELYIDCECVTRYISTGTPFYRNYFSKIVIGDQVTTIEDYIFNVNANLKHIVIGDSVTSIGDYAFYDTPCLEKIEGSYTSQDKRCLIVDNKLIAFAPANLTEYNVPENVIALREGVMRYDNLTSITLPSTTQSIGKHAFDPSLEQLFCKAIVPPSIDSNTLHVINRSTDKIYVPYTSIDAYKAANGWKDYAEYIFAYDFSTNTVIKEKPEDNEICYISTKQVSPYDSSAFNANIISNEWNANTGIGVITFDNTITQVGMSAFQDCTSITTINLPDCITSIGRYAFKNCGLTSFTFPISLTKIGDCALSGCPIETLICNTDNPFTLIQDDDYSYYVYEGLGVSTTTLCRVEGKYAYLDNKALIVNGYLYAFAGKGSSSYSLTLNNLHITSYVFSNYELAALTLNNCSVHTGAFSDITIGTLQFISSDITSRGMSGKVSKLTIDNKSDIGDEAFDIYCQSMHIDTTIVRGNWSDDYWPPFYYSQISEVTFGPNVKLIGEGALDNSWTKTIYCKSTTPPTLEDYAIGNSIERIYVPSSNDNSITNAYKMADGWSDYASYIEEYDFSAEQ